MNKKFNIQYWHGQYVELLNRGLTAEQAVEELSTYLHPLTIARLKKFIMQADSSLPDTTEAS